jgi:hypothetical protein
MFTFRSCCSCIWIESSFMSILCQTHYSRVEPGGKASPWTASQTGVGMLQVGRWSIGHEVSRLGKDIYCLALASI